MTAELTTVSDAFADAGLAGVVDDTALTRAMYSTDASLYRIPPRLVARPTDLGEYETTLRVARELALPITLRGAGTSCAGNAVGSGLVIDTRRLDRIIAIDPERRTALVEPGVVQDQLNVAARTHGLLFGPDPSTSSRCTIGGMIGNNACGPRAMGYGRTADNVVGLDVVTGTGDRFTVGDPGSTLTDVDHHQVTALRKLGHDHLAEIRTGFGRFGRQVSGYSMEHLLPENGAAVHRFLAGTEGTLASILQAEVRLVSDPPYRTMIAVGYPSMPEAGDAAVMLARHKPTAAEGLDRRIVDVVRQAKGDGAVPPLPRGDGWMFIELVDDDPERLRERARALAEEAAPAATEVMIVDDPVARSALWQIRADGAGLAGVSFDRPAYPGWEDAAVPPASLGDYLRDFEKLLRTHRLRGLPYGHFGDGCVHVRIDFELDAPDGARSYRRFVTEAAQLVASYGGSMSGEHGDGRARSELLSIMYTPDQLKLFGAVKNVMDPHDLLNPGVLVDPAPFAASLRVPQMINSPIRRQFGHFAEQVHQCSGVGKCVGDNTGTLQVMCPSYQATGDEKDSTRGRARVLQEMINGQVITGGWSAPEVHEALDLCLSCKGCARDCPTGIDMAAYKATVLDQTWKGRLRPRAHYALGWLPRWGRMITAVPGLAGIANLGMRLPGIRSLIKWSAGVDQRRQLPAFATRHHEHPALAAAARAELPTGTPGAGVAATDDDRPPVVIWSDSFTSAFTDDGTDAMTDVLVAAGYAPQRVVRDACCGLTWISTGQLAGARRQLRHALDILHPIALSGVPIVGAEPSCLAVWRSDAPELLPDDARASVVAESIVTLAELLGDTPGWKAPDLSGTTLVVQPHCHHASVVGWGADAALLSATGADVVTVGGCCGLAGNFGVEDGHYDISVRIAEQELLPAVRAGGDDAVVLADGFSCRTQLAELADRRAITLAELLAGKR